MQYDKFLFDDKRRILNIVKNEYITLDFSNLLNVFDNNFGQPLWMDVSVLLYSLNIEAPSIAIFDIILNKLSRQFARFYFKNGDKKYIVEADEHEIKMYVWYLITEEKVVHSINSKFIPQKDYIKKILSFCKFSDSGIFIKHISENKFELEPINEHFENIEEAENVYDGLLETQDLFKNLKLNTKNFVDNYLTAKLLCKDKRMIATLSNILSSFKCNYVLQDSYITLNGTDIIINDEDTAMSFQSKLIDSYHFFRNVINTTNKKDIVSEIYNKRVDPAIKEQFEMNIPEYLNVIKNKELIDWIVTISKESKYTLKINYDEQGVFYIDGAVIASVQDAKEYYIDYMDKKKEKLAMSIYGSGIISKIKRAWNIFKSRIGKKSYEK